MIISYFLLLLALLLRSTQQHSDPPTRYSILKQLPLSSTTPSQIQQSNSGQYILAASDSIITMYKNSKVQTKPSKPGNVRQFEYQLLNTWNSTKNNITAIGGSHDLSVFAVAETDNKLKVYYKPRSKQPHTIIQTIDDAMAQITNVVFIANDLILVTASLDGTVNLYWKQKIESSLSNTQTTKSSAGTNTDDSNKNAAETPTEPSFYYNLFQTIESRNKVESIAFASNNTMLYIGFGNRSMTAHRFTNDKVYQFSYVINGLIDNVRSIAINEDGNILALATGASVIIYKSDVFGLNPKPVQGIYDANSSLNKIALRRDGGVLISTSSDGHTRTYNFYDGRYLLNDTWKAQVGIQQSNSLSLQGNILILSDKNKITIYQSCISSIARCSSCLNQTMCYGCIDNYFLTDTGVCHTCSLFQGCKTCVTENMCTSCFSGYFLNIEIGVCQSCTNSLRNCKSCSSRYVCTECFLEFDLVNQVCEFPINPNIPVPLPIVPTIKTPSLLDDYKVDNTHKWMITLIVLIIILCVLIIAMLIVMTVLCLKVFKKLKTATFNPKMMYAKGMEPIPPMSQRNIGQNNAIKDQVNELKQPTETAKLQSAKPNPKIVPVALEPEEKIEDQFKQLRP